MAPWYKDIPAWALVAAASAVFLLGLGGGIVSRQLLPSQPAVGQATRPVAPSLMPQLSPEVTSAEVAAMERRILRTMDARMDQRMQPVAAHGRLQTVGLSRQEVLGLTSAVEERQRQDMRANNLRLLKDSQKMYVTNAQFNEVMRQLRYEVQQALISQQQGH